MDTKERCDGFTAGGLRCPRTVAVKVGSRLKCCHQHAQIAERDPARAKLWRKAKREREAEAAA